MRGPEEKWADARSSLTLLFWFVLAGFLFFALASFAQRALFQSLRHSDDIQGTLRMVGALMLLRALVDLAIQIFAIVTFARLAGVPAPSVKGLAAGALAVSAIAALFSLFDVVVALHQLTERGKPLVSDSLQDYLWYAGSVAVGAQLVAAFLVAMAVTRLFKRPQPTVTGVGAITVYAVYALLPIVLFKLVESRFMMKNPWTWSFLIAVLLVGWGVLYALTLLSARDAIPVRR